MQKSERAKFSLIGPDVYRSWEILALDKGVTIKQEKSIFYVFFCIRCVGFMLQKLICIIKLKIMMDYQFFCERQRLWVNLKVVVC